MSECIPWDDLVDGYYKGLSVREGLPAKDARLVIGAVIIKHKLCLSEEEAVQQIQENPHLQYFVGLPLSDGSAICALVICGDPQADGSVGV